MLFNGSDLAVAHIWDHVKILQYLKNFFPGMQKSADPPNATASHYRIPGHRGEVGIIAAYTRSFCGSCNRIRITPTGTLRTCLYDPGTFNIKEAIREGYTDPELKELIHAAVRQKTADGWEAQKLLLTNNTVHQSMATIGG